MAKNTMHKAFPFTAFVTHMHDAGEYCRDVVTVSASNSSNFTSTMSLDERQAAFAKLREKYPDRIPVIIQVSVDGKDYGNGNKKFMFPAEIKLAAFFTCLWKKLYEIKLSWGTYSLCPKIEQKDPIFETSLASAYEEFKDEDGHLYLTLSGETRGINTQPYISLYTCYEQTQGNKNLKDSERAAALKRMKEIHVVNTTGDQDDDDKVVIGCCCVRFVFRFLRRPRPYMSVLDRDTELA